LRELSVVSAVLGQGIKSKINQHVETIAKHLSLILNNDKYKNNNHRIFHLLAAFIHADAARHDEEKKSLRRQIEDFINELIDPETGFSVEQSISYCLFDLAIVKNIIQTMNGLSAGMTIDAASLEKSLNSHMAAIAFPDGSLPASGDSYGLMLSPYQKKFMPEYSAMSEHWLHLDRMGYYRGCSNDGSVHFLMLSHNAESAHGHASPLHTDIWFKEIGLILSDVGGPYRYLSSLRYNWFISTMGHNSLTVKGKNKLILKNISISTAPGRHGLIGYADYDNAIHNKALFAYRDKIVIHESVKEPSSQFEIYYNFSIGAELTRTSEQTFEIRKAVCPNKKIIIKTNADPKSLIMKNTERCIGNSKYVYAPSIIYSPQSANQNYYLSLSKESLSN
jgi:hypothetical protein